MGILLRKKEFKEYKTDIESISEYATNGLVSSRYYAICPKNTVVNGGKDFRFYLGITPSAEKLVEEYRKGARVELEGKVLQEWYALADVVVSLGQLRGEFTHGFNGKIVVNGKERYRAFFTSSEVPEAFWTSEISELGEISQ